MCIICDGTYIGKEELKIENCDIIKSIPIINGLKQLEINNCSSLTDISNIIQNIDSLKNLEINKCSSLIELSNINYLEKLKVYDCISLSIIKDIDIIEILEIIKCNSLILIENIYVIKQFKIKRCNSIEIINNIDHVNDLIIIKCKSLKTIDVNGSKKNIDSVYSLTIKICKSLKNIIGIYNELTIHNCKSLEEIPVDNIYEDLTIYNCNSIKYITNSITNNITVYNLYIVGCNSLISLSNINELEFSVIGSCDFLSEISNINYLENTSCYLEIKNCKSLKKMININVSNLLIDKCKSLITLPYCFNKNKGVLIENCTDLIKYIKKLNLYHEVTMYIEIDNTNTIRYPYIIEDFNKSNIVINHLSKVNNNESFCNICYDVEYDYKNDDNYDEYIENVPYMEYNKYENIPYTNFYSQLYKCSYCPFNIHINCLYKSFIKGGIKCVHCKKSYE